MSGVLVFLFYLIVLVLGGALEELLPKMLGVGVPILLGWTLFAAVHRNAPTVVVLAIAAGAFEDALSALPFLTSVSFFVVAALVANRVCGERGLAVLPALMVAYPLYQAWLWLVAVPVVPSAWGLVLGAACLMSLAASVVVAFFARCERRAAI